MKVMFKQSFKNMGYCWLMSDIAKKLLSFSRQRAISHNEHVNVLFSFPAWKRTVHRRLVSKKIGKCYGGIRSGL